MIDTYLVLLATGVLLGGVYLLMAVGLNLIYGVMRVVNLAHGDFIVVGGLLTFSLFQATGLVPVLAMPIAGLLLLMIGIAFQQLVLRRLELGTPRGELRTLLATFGLSYLVANAGFLIWGARFQSVPYLQGGVDIGVGSVREALIVASVVAFCVALAVGVWLTRTKTGKTVRATAQSELGAASCGLNIRRIRMLAFGLGSAMAGAAGTLVIMVQPLQTASGAVLTVQAFTVIALGGLGNYGGAFLAAVLLGVLSTMTSYFFGPAAGAAALYVAFIATLTLRPQGLFGRAVRV